MVLHDTATTTDRSEILQNLEFHERLQKGNRSQLVRVTLEGQQYALKVYSSIPWQFQASKLRETDTFTCESTAYRRLVGQGLCDAGIVPRFIGAFDKFDPGTALPHLADFVDDDLRPNPVLMEYVPDLQMIDLTSFTEQRR
ncbi:hypothetical protein K461DRAFT_295681 [Myriangium duriaei CBS 260.36]|uniref:Aminoglycoside phosphotransferase domain-containing protein n=1 Tax=Myriangium duriaei CBS 260.36 TaxID=1168546 RepID=A0A9P4IUW0_9PEZI|nr:hypothetical protein K461DRAFT_295681 [Myriangium duriaei CBS 260.36]